MAQGHGGAGPLRPAGAGADDRWCAVVLAAGRGDRLRPLTLRLPKALCPVGNVPLLDRALTLLVGLGLRGPDRVAVNASWLGEQVAAHVTGRATVSREPDGPLGTAGGVARLRDWVDGRDVLVVNADAYLAAEDSDGATGWVAELLADPQRGTVRLLGVPAAPGSVEAFGGYRFAGMSALPWRWVRDLPAGPAELVHTTWRPAEAAEALEMVQLPGHFVDTGTPAGYLAANRHAAAGGNLLAPDATVTGRCRCAVVGAGAEVRGDLTRAVVWPGARVRAGEHLVDAVRAGDDLTVTADGA